MWEQMKYSGYDIAKMSKDVEKLTKTYMESGTPKEKAKNQAIAFVEYYKHTYRIFEKVGK